MSNTQSSETARLSNGVEIELITAGNSFLGLGAVRAGGATLRSGRLPMFVEIRTPDALLLTDYTVAGQEITADRIQVVLTASGKADGIQEWMNHEVRNRYRTTDWTEGPQPLAGVTVTLTIEPLTRTIGGRVYQGLVYLYGYSGAEHPIYKILDRGSWEIGGRAVGNEFWMRNCFVPPIMPIDSVDQFLSTEWYMPGITNPNIFQFLPLQTELQGFSFTASEAGTLITWPSRVSHVRSLFEKPRGKDEIIHWHEHCGDLAAEFESAPMEVLFCPGALDRTGRYNAYEAVKELVHEALHAELGMERERITTHAQCEEWGLPDFDRYRLRGLPKLLEAGAKTIYIANHFENNMNTYGVTNMCCTVDYKFAETVGEDKIKAYCDDVHAAGARVEMWANTSISSLTWIFANPNSKKQRIDFLPFEGSIMDAFKDVPNALVRNAAGALEADHYSPVFCVMNLREQVVREYWLRRFREAHEIGLDGIFLDSSFNLSSDKFHWSYFRDAQAAGATPDQMELLGHLRPAAEPPSAIQSQYRAHLDLMAEMQAIGYHYCNEDLGVFGTHRHGPAAESRLDSLPLWSDCIANFDIPALQAAGADPDEVFFRGLAYRMMWTVVWDIDADKLSWNYGGVRGEHDSPCCRHIALLKAYTQIEPIMHRREILAGEAGVVYAGRPGDPATDGKRVLWAFRDFTFPLEAETVVCDVLSGKTFRTREISAQAQKIYIIG